MKHQAPGFATVILLLAGILAAIFVVNALQRPQREGELTFNVESVDAGRVPLGQAVIQRFAMRNVGDRPVTITRRQVNALEGC